MGGDERMGFVGLVLESRDQAARVNQILGEFGEMIRGRMGVPDREAGGGVIGLIVEGTNDRIGALTGRLGSLKGVQVKSALMKRQTANDGK